MTALQTCPRGEDFVADSSGSQPGGAGLGLF